MREYSVFVQCICRGDTVVVDVVCIRLWIIECDMYSKGNRMRLILVVIAGNIQYSGGVFDGVTLQ